jgi:hypothetical protein
MPVPEKLKALVDQMPNPDDGGMYRENIDKEKIEKAAAEIAKGGRQNMLGLIEMLGEPGSEENVKPHYALHCVVNHTLVAGDKNGQKELCQAMASQLSGDLSTYNKAYLCQELQWAGGREVTPALGSLLTDEELCNPAAMALAAIKDGAAEQFRGALPRAKGACRLAIVDGLAALGDKQSAGVLKDALKDSDREVRIAAGAGLAKLGDAGSADVLLKAVPSESGWERIQAIKNCLVLAEKLMAAGNKSEAGKLYKALQGMCSDPTEKYLREAIEKALAAA